MSSRATSFFWRAVAALASATATFRAQSLRRPSEMEASAFPYAEYAEDLAFRSTILDWTAGDLAETFWPH